MTDKNDVFFVTGMCIVIVMMAIFFVWLIEEKNKIDETEELMIQTVHCDVLKAMITNKSFRMNQELAETKYLLDCEK